MAEPYFGELFKTKAITDADLNAAVDAYFAYPTTNRFIMGEGQVADLAAVVASAYAQGMLADPGVKEASKRAAERTAILLARPVKE